MRFDKNKFKKLNHIKEMRNFIFIKKIKLSWLLSNYFFSCFCFIWQIYFSCFFIF